MGAYTTLPVTGVQRDYYIVRMHGGVNLFGVYRFQKRCQGAVGKFLFDDAGLHVMLSPYELFRFGGTIYYTFMSYEIYSALKLPLPSDLCRLVASFM